MICESCQCSKTKILETRTNRDPDGGFHYCLRRHRCYACAYIFWTVELPTANWEQTLKGEFNVEYGD
jgi:transcriptional regulator NrdR family protein